MSEKSSQYCGVESVDNRLGYKVINVYLGLMKTGTELKTTELKTHIKSTIGNRVTSLKNA